MAIRVWHAVCIDALWKKKGTGGATRMNVSIVIPAYNEALRIGATLETVAAHAAAGSFYASSYEVFVVCDGCRDATEQVARRFADRLPLRVVSYPVNRGKGYAVRQGVALSTGRVVAFMDADGATPVRELEGLAQPILRNQAPIVIGSRRAKGARLTVPQPLHRRVLGRAFALHTRLVLKMPVQDTQCGFKAFRGDVARDLFAALQCDGFAFDLELLAQAQARGLRVLELGVEWQERPGSTVHPLRDGLRMLRAAWQIRNRMRAGCPAAAAAPFPASAQPLKAPLS